MKKSLLLGTALASLGFASLTFAYSPTEKPAAGVASAPKIVPVKTVAVATLPPNFVRGQANVEFTVDRNGCPQGIHILSISDTGITRQVLQSFSQWRFAGALSEAAQANQRYVLPVVIAPEA